MASALSTTKSPEAARVFECLLKLERDSRAGRTYSIIGHHCEAHKHVPGGDAPDRLAQRVGEITDGIFPGFLEFDLGPGNGARSFNDSDADFGYVFRSVERAREWWESRSGLVGFSFHLPYPGSARKDFDQVSRRPSDSADLDDAWFSRVSTIGTRENAALCADLDWAIATLKPLQRARVPLLFRPFHEMNKTQGEFWWSNRPHADFKRLWDFTVNRFAEVGMNNLIFVWSPYAWDSYAKQPWDFYPNTSPDVVAVDLYAGDPPYNKWYYDGLKDYNRPRMLAEVDKMPIRQGRSYLEDQPWAIWSVWSYTLERDVNNEHDPNQRNLWNVDNQYGAVRETYTHSEVLTSKADWSDWHR